MRVSREARALPRRQVAGVMAANKSGMESPIGVHDPKDATGTRNPGEDTVPQIRFSKTSVTRFTSLAAVLLCFLVRLAPLSAQATAIPGTTAVGSSASAVPVQVVLPNGGTIAAVQVLGQGIANVDFVSNGGTCEAGASFQAGQNCSLSVVFSPVSPGTRNGAVVLLDSSNRPIGTQLLTASATGSVGVFVPGIVNTVAGGYSWVYSGDGVAAAGAPIFLPFGIAVDGSGNLFIADSSNNRIRRVDAVTQIITTYAGNGVVGSGGDQGAATNASLNNPTSLALDPAGDLYIADSGNNVIRRVDAFTHQITTVAGTLGTHGYSGDNGPATSATFTSPNGISFDANGDLYIADTGNAVIRMVGLNGMITTVAGSGTQGYGGDNGPAMSARLNAPWSATPIPPSVPGVNAGFYIADQNNDRIRKVDASGKITTIAGGSAGYSGDNGPATAAQLYEPASVLVDVAGNIYIADSGNNLVRRINADTGIITSYAGNNTEQFSGDGGPANQAGFYGPYAFALDSKGSLYIADVFHNRIRKVDANSAILQFPVMRVDRVSSPLPQIIENDGNAPMVVSRFNPVSNSQLDPASTTCSLTQPLAVLKQCTVGVDFAPLTIGKLVTGELDLDSNAGNSPGAISLEAQVLDVNPTVIALTSSQNPSVTGQSVNFTASVTNTANETPTGTATFLDGTTILGTGTLANGSASFSTSTLISGNHAITASYGGDSQNAAGVSTILTQVVKDQSAATTTTLSSNANNTPAGAQIGFTATVNIVTANSGNGSITGIVSFQQGTNVLGTANINTSSATASTGVATISLTNLPVGTDSIVAVYAGNSSYATSTSTPVVQTVISATTQTSLASSANPSLSGAALSLTATVTGNGGVPTGTVNFLDGGNALGSAPLNAQGVAALSAPGRFWSVGNHTLTAVYAGDANDNASTSTPLTEGINIAPTTTTLASSLNPAGLGASITFNVTVTSQGGTPSGSVQFLDGASPIGSGTLTPVSATSGAASFTTTTLALGGHAITAVYAGDALDQTSTSTGLSETIQAATDGVNLASTANPSVFGAPLTLTVQVNGTGSTPTGNVSLMDGATTVATQPLPANGLVAFLNPALAIGAHTLTAAYSGDTNHAAANSALLTETIEQATTTGLTSSSSALVAGQSVTLTATVSGNSGKALSGNPAGSVTFTDAGALLGTITPNANGVATYSTAGMLPGQHTITATFTGDSLDAASASSTSVVNVTIATTTTTFTTSANPVNSGSPLTLTASVLGNGGTPTGSITFKDGGTTLTSVQLTSAGTASFSLSTLAPGIHQLSAVYSGDTLDNPSTSPVTAEQVVESTSVTMASSENPSLLQDNVAISITVSNGTTLVPTGSVTLTDGTTTLATLKLSATGTALYAMQAPGVGTHVLVVNYLGDNSNSPAASQPLNQVVNLRPSTVTFNPSGTAISYGQQVTLISVVQGNGSTPATGTVTWVAGGTTLGSAPVDASGLATLNVSPAQGVFATVAQYSGDSLYAPSASAPTTITVGPTTEFTINLTPSTLSMASGSHGMLNLNITSAATFSDTLAIGCAGLPAYATCTFSTNQVPVGGGVAKSLSVEVDTGNPLGAGASASLRPTASSTAYSCALPVGAVLALLLGLNRRKLRRINPKFALFALIVLLGAGSTVLTGCGSDLNVSKTAAGSYTFQIVASGNKTGVTQTATVQLTVTQ
jgi:sugar lactone lactonase YvrE